MNSKESIQLLGKVILVIEDLDGSNKKIIESTNLITNAGDLFYAQRANQEIPTNDFHIGQLILGTAGNAPSKTSIYSDITAKVNTPLKDLEPGYPKRNDLDVSNTGAAIDSLTYKYKYLSVEGNSTGINRIAIIIPSPVGDSPLLMYATVTSFTKDTSKILTIFINHNFKGV